MDLEVYEKIARKGLWTVLVGGRLFNDVKSFL